MAKKMLKMRYNGELFEQYYYPQLYRLPGEPEPRRGKREKETTKAKKEINRRERKVAFMRTAQANFAAGRDLAVSLHFSQPVTMKQARRCLNKFLSLRRKRHAAEWKAVPSAEKKRRHNRGEDAIYRAMMCAEDHSEEGQPINLHFHLLMSRNPDRKRQALAGIREDWARACGDFAGSAKVETLEGSDCFMQLAAYYLKMRREKGVKAWTSTRSCKAAPPPVYQRIPDRDVPDLPPGCMWIDGHDDFNPLIGAWGYRICRVTDQRKFRRWWNKLNKNIHKS